MLALARAEAQERRILTAEGGGGTRKGTAVNSRMGGPHFSGCLPSGLVSDSFFKMFGLKTRWFSAGNEGMAPTT